MKIFLTGANGYIGSQLLLLLLDAGHEVIALVRNKFGIGLPENHPLLTVIAGDLLNPETLVGIPDDIDAAYYLVHSMSSNSKSFANQEEQAVKNFLTALEQTHVKQIIYLSGLCSETHLSPHLASRYRTECLIKASSLTYTIFRAGIIIGSGSASFEIIKDLVEKLPVMVAPRWVNNLCQPIAISDVLRYLIGALNSPDCLNQVFDIGGPEQLSYREMLLTYASVRGLKRYCWTVPVLTPRLSSYWLYFVTSVNFNLASALVESVKNQAICHENRILTIFPQPCLSYRESIERAIDLIEQNPLLPSWKDSLISPDLEDRLATLGKAPTHGCFKDEQRMLLKGPREEVINRIWSIGGETGWYYMNWAWKIRGVIDKCVGGVGLQRGRGHASEIRPGASLDFWRVLAADKSTGHLLLYAEMKLPGEAWLEFRIVKNGSKEELVQIATFRPKGLFGRLYWYAMWPFHLFIFKGMAKNIAYSKTKID